LPFLVTALFKSRETFLPVIYYVLWRRALVNLATVTLTQGRRDETKDKDQQSERLAERGQHRTIPPAVSDLNVTRKKGRKEAQKRLVLLFVLSCASLRLNIFAASTVIRGELQQLHPSVMQIRSKEKLMYRTNVNRIVQALVLIALVTLAATSAFAFDNSNGPELPEECSSIRVPEGNKLTFHAYAKGVQIYKWNLITQKWDLLAPQAGLFAEENYFGEIGSHYAGPRWESKSGSIVEGRRVLGTGCTPDPTAVAWILLSKFTTEGSGIFSKVTYIQRVNTIGGLAPTEPGLINGETKQIPYTAEYYFYKAENPNSN
jgi:hypothetical protein